VPFYGRGPDRGGDTFSKLNTISGQWPRIQIKETGEIWKNPCALVLRHGSMFSAKAIDELVHRSHGDNATRETAC
jgi:hypothetical protein